MATVTEAVWKQYADKVSKQDLAAIKKSERDLREMEKRVVKARKDAMKKGLRGEALDEARDTLKCAIDDMKFHSDLLRETIIKALPKKFREVEVEDDSRFEQDPREVKRKLEFEVRLGRPLQWKEYWKILDAHYAERSSVEQERYEECVRDYVFKIDSARDMGGSFDSDSFGKPLYSESTAKTPSAEPRIMDRVLNPPSAKKSEVRK